MYGWELVNSVSAQGGESTITITGINTNDVYALVMYDIWMTADARPRYRFTSSGSQDSGSNYKYSSEDAYSDGALSVSKYNSTGSGASYYNGFTHGTHTGDSLNGIFYLYDFNYSDRFSSLIQKECVSNSSSLFAVRTGGISNTNATAHDGLYFFTSTSTYKHGTWDLYRIT
tara:strand:- start:2647 stop:3162 length:516 start_codon:yes stop_codon:yes gene_type:complete